MRVLLPALLLMCMVAQPQGKQPVRKQDDRSNPNTDIKQHQADERPYFFCIGCPVRQVSDKTQQEKEDEAFTNRLYRWYMGATILGVVGGFIGLFLIWREVKATKIAANAARDNARSVISAERAWFLVGKTDPPYPCKVRDGFQTFCCEFEMANFGKTPAKILFGHFDLVIGDSNAQPPPKGITFFYSRPMPVRHPYVIPPGQPRIQRAFHDAIPDQEFPDINDIKGFLWLCGQVEYDDVFSRDNRGEHETVFCYWYDVKTRTWIPVSSEHNRAT